MKHSLKFHSTEHFPDQEAVNNVKSNMIDNHSSTFSKVKNEAVIALAKKLKIIDLESSGNSKFEQFLSLQFPWLRIRFTKERITIQNEPLIKVCCLQHI